MSQAIAATAAAFEETLEALGLAEWLKSGRDAALVRQAAERSAARMR